MLIVNDAWRSSDLPCPSVATVGNYDGIHLGQQAVIDRVTARARELELASVLVTFEPHSRVVLRPEAAPRLLTTPRQKRRLVAARGVDCMAALTFDAELAATPAADFVSEFLVRRLGVREIFVGSRFTFGRGGSGDLALLTEMSAARAFRVTGVDELLRDGEAVSSTRIRRAVAAGEVEKAGVLLDRAYTLEGEIVRGDGRGRTIGFPTANLAPSNELLPAGGVYAATLRVLDGGDEMAGVANVGTRPTVEADGAVSVEIHVFDFAGDLYDAEVEVGFHRRLRSERRFGSLEELTAQIDRDAEAAREYFATASCYHQRRERVAAAPATTNHQPNKAEGGY